MRKNLLCFSLCFFILSTILFGCNKSSKISNDDEGSQVTKESTTTHDDAIDISDYSKPEPVSSLGFVLGLSDEKNNKYKSSSINIDPSTDFKAILNSTYYVAPDTNEGIEYALLFYIDYKQVDFSVGTDPTKIKKLVSKAKNEVENKALITLPTSGLTGSHRLTIITQYTKYVGQTMIPDSFCRSFDLNIGKDTAYEIKDKKNNGINLNTSASIDQKDLIINRNFILETEDSTNIAKSTSLVIKAKKGQDLSLAVRAPQVATDGLLFLTLNNEQILINNEEYLYFTGMKNIMYKKITLKTPTKAGEYQLNGYFIHSPWEKGSDLTALCHSIKLIIE